MQLDDVAIMQNVIPFDLRAVVDETTAGLMLTNPSTLGLFDENMQNRVSGDASPNQPDASTLPSRATANWAATW